VESKLLTPLDGLCVGKKEGLHADGIGNRLLIGQIGSRRSVSSTGLNARDRDGWLYDPLG
jgi:hypothetical protein